MARHTVAEFILALIAGVGVVGLSYLAWRGTDIPVGDADTAAAAGAALGALCWGVLMLRRARTAHRAGGPHTRRP